MTRRKQVQVTDEILTQIERVTGNTVLAEDIVVFEAAALSTKALTKRGSIYHGARPSRQLLVEMSDALNSGEQSVPLHTLHRQGGELPVGRLFHASVADESDGSSTLQAMFYLPASEKDLVEKINLAVLDEVSVGMKSRQALCSKCGFDFFGAEASFVHLWDQTCEEGHTIGTDGAHLMLIGLDYWMELSLVSRGASNKPKIMSRAKSSLPQATYDRIAASGMPVEALILITESIPMPNPNPQTFDAEAEINTLKEQVAALTAAAAAEPAVVVEEVIVEQEEPNVEALQAELAAAQARIAELEAAGPLEQEVIVEDPPVVQLDLPVDGLSASSVATGEMSKPQGTQRAASFKTKHR